MNSPPIVVSYGMGTNSTALLIGMKERGMRPDLIMAADTGDEHPHTYEHLARMQQWCADNDFPKITVVKNDLPQGVIDGSLYGECLRLGTLPSKVFGRSGCSQKWKLAPQYKYLKQWLKTLDISFVRHFIGYDADEQRRANKEVPQRDFEKEEYPLIQWGWGRDECVAAIARAGIPQPGKSACFMCPSSRKPEVKALKEKYPVLYMKAVVIERRALAGEGQAPAARVAGLGRHWNWESFAGVDSADEIDCACYDGANPDDE